MLPNWVKGRDGKVEPFDADGISERLFAAAQTLGAADAFLIRELSDGVLHFLNQEDLGDTTTRAAIDDVVEKVVRELGQPDLARAFAARSEHVAEPVERRPLSIPFSPADDPSEVARHAIESFSLRCVFAKDVAAANAQGVIRLGGLTSPRTMDAAVVDASALDDDGDPFDAAWNLVAAGAQRAGRLLVLDSPDWMLNDDPKIVDDLVRGLDRAAAAFDRRVDVHVSAVAPPPWACENGDEPLFESWQAEVPTSSQLWLNALANASDRVRLAWHWRNSQDVDAPFVDWLGAGRPCTIVFDRRRRPLSFGCGLNRQRPGIVFRVGLDLPRLLNRPDVACQGDVFLDKLPSLTRLAVSASIQKRNYLRRHAEHLGREFVLDRAATCIEPLGFVDVLQQLMGVPAPTTKPARALAAKILAALYAPLEESRTRTGMEFLLDAPQTNATQVEVWFALEHAARGKVDADCLEVTVDTSDVNWATLFDEVYRKSAVCAIHNVRAPREASRGA